jgi:hypothetical protein
VCAGRALGMFEEDMLCVRDCGHVVGWMDGAEERLQRAFVPLSALPAVAVRRMPAWIADPCGHTLSFAQASRRVKGADRQAPQAWAHRKPPSEQGVGKAGRASRQSALVLRRNGQKVGIEVIASARHIEHGQCTCACPKAVVKWRVEVRTATVTKSMSRPSKLEVPVGFGD